MKFLKLCWLPLVSITLGIIYFLLAPPTPPVTTSGDPATEAKALAELELVATYNSEHLTIQLNRSLNVSCMNLMKHDPPGSWREANMIIHEDSTDSTTTACWRQYQAYDAVYDGRHYADPVFAICPLHDGASQYDGCITLRSSTFAFK